MILYPSSTIVLVLVFLVALVATDSVAGALRALAVSMWLEAGIVLLILVAGLAAGVAAQSAAAAAAGVVLLAFIVAEPVAATLIWVYAGRQLD